MSTYNLDAFFSPRSIALIGASRRARSVGRVVADNLFSGGFEGPILPVNPHEAAIRGVLAYKDVESLPAAPDLAVVATPAATVPGIIEALGKRGCRAAVVLSAGFENGEPGGTSPRDALRLAAQRSGMRIIGPNCLGVMAPHKGVNASFAHLAPFSGRIACVMQSGALAAAVLDWATARGIGFSKMISLGDAIDVDFGDLLNYLAVDPETDAILLYVEGITHARKFMAAARAAARVKPVIAMKAGHNATAAHAVKSHTGALAGSDRVYDAAFRRAGIVRVGTMDDMFDALEVLARPRRFRGERLAILTNGGGAGVLATDALAADGGVLATLSPETVATLNSVLPPTWSQGNPVDIIGDATGARYAAALQAVAADPAVDAILVMNCPTAVASASEAAEAVIAETAREDAQGTGKPVLGCWLGSHAAIDARSKLSAAGIPSYPTPEQAIDGFAYLAELARGAAHLDEVGQDIVRTVDRGSAALMLHGALKSGREWLDESDSEALLAAYGIPVAQSVKAATPQQVGEAARAIGGKVAVKIRSSQIIHKSDHGGVALNLATPEEARGAAQAMLDRIQASNPDIRLEGFVVSEMIDRPNAVELIAGLTDDATFGPTIVFGQGGVAVSALDDAAVALPPLTPVLADDLIARTRVSRLLKGYRNHPPVALGALKEVLMALAQIASDHPEITELDINPLLANEDGVIALDARIRVRDPALAVPPALVAYPRDLEHVVDARDGGKILIRPIRPEDAPALQHFIENLDPTTIRARFFETMKRLPAALLAQLTQIDYDREMAFVAIDLRGQSIDADPRDQVICGVGRIIIPPVGKKATYALTACPTTIGRGVAHALMVDLMAYARGHGMQALCGDELADSVDLIRVARDHGGTAAPDPEDPTVTCILLPLLPIADAA